MNYRTNPDRILDNIDRSRNREAEDTAHRFQRDASARALLTEVPDSQAPSSERVRRVFQGVEEAYKETAQGNEMKRLAARFQAIGDIYNHHARGDVSITVQYLDSARDDDIAMAPFEVQPDELEEEKKETRTSRADANALRVLRRELRNGTMAAYKKLEPRIRDAVRDRADLGHVGVQVTIDLRPAS